MSAFLVPLFLKPARFVGATLWTLVFLFAPPGVFAAPNSPFIAALGGVYDGPGNAVGPEVFQSSTSGTLQPEVGALPTTYGKFRSAFGSSGFTIQVTGGLNREVDGGSIWSDGFAISGGTGNGVLQLSTHIEGSMSGNGDMFYALFVSAQPFDLQSVIETTSANHQGFWALQLPNATRVLFTGVANGCGASPATRECGHVPFQDYEGSLNLLLTTSTPFTFGQTLYAISVFGGGVHISGGNRNFLNSADFGITAPTGTTMQSISGVQYASAVPEPASWWLLVAGLVCGVARRAMNLKHKASTAFGLGRPCRA